MPVTMKGVPAPPTHAELDLVQLGQHDAAAGQVPVAPNPLDVHAHRAHPGVELLRGELQPPGAAAAPVVRAVAVGEEAVVYGGGRLSQACERKRSAAAAELGRVGGLALQYGAADAQRVDLIRSGTYT